MAIFEICGSAAVIAARFSLPAVRKANSPDLHTPGELQSRAAGPSASLVATTTAGAPYSTPLPEGWRWVLGEFHLWPHSETIGLNSRKVGNAVLPRKA